MSLKSNGALDLKTLFAQHKDKGEREAAVKLLNEVDHVIRRNEASAGLASTVLTALSRTYENYAMNTTIMKPKEQTDGQDKPAKPNLRK